MKRGFIFILLIISIISVMSFVSAECSDSDNGINYYSKGSAQDGNQAISDICVADNPKQLFEAYCENGVANSVAYDCPNGCSDGACVCPTTTCSDGTIHGPEKCNVRDNICECPACAPTTPITCSAMPTCNGAEDTGQKDSDGCPIYSCQATAVQPIPPTQICKDSDNGKNFYQQGTTCADNNCETDICLENVNTLLEYFCENNIVSSGTYGCEKGCSNGACVSSTTTTSCSDTDGGINYYEKGSLMFDGKIAAVDSCEADGITLREESCVPNPGPNEGTMLTNIYKCPNGCKDGVCIKGEKQREEIKCIFKGTETQQKCYRAEYNWMYCSSYQGSCIVTNLEGYDGEKITWKSSCGGYAYTVLDGNNEQIEFDCSGAVGNFCQSTQCSDGSWSKCYVDGSGYCACSTCPQIIVKPVCGNGVCESGEGQRCMAIVPLCEAGKECKGITKCKLVCSEDCKNIEGIYAKLNEKFKLQVNQPVKITDYKNLKIIFKDLITANCEAATTNVEEVKSKLTAYAVAETASSVTEEKAVEIIKCPEVGPMAQLEIINSEEQGGKILTLKLNEAKNIYDISVSFLEYDYASRTGVFIVSNKPLTCPVNCKCDSEGYILECKKEEKCEKEKLLCPDGICKEKCEEILIENCNYGCIYDTKCLPIGVRVKGLYCNIDGTLINQLQAEESCENNFECSSNVCVSGQCVSEKIIRKIINWFKNIFGGE